MRNSLAIDPTTALMFSQLDVDDAGRVRSRRAAARRHARGRRRFEAHTRLLKLLA